MTDITQSYAEDLLGMGYTQDWVAKVLDSALVGYERLLHRVGEGEISRNRLSFETDMERRHRRLFSNTSWFKKW